MIQVKPGISIDENEIQMEFVQSSGPGGQNVNKVATAVQLRFDAANSASLPREVSQRLISSAGSRVTKEGIIIINARRFRSQEANRQDALRRLVDLVSNAARTPRVRRKTRPTHGSQVRRLESKHRRAKTKRLRRPAAEESD
jgi:ribosome-associated protein